MKTIIPLSVPAVPPSSRPSGGFLPRAAATVFLLATGWLASFYHLSAAPYPPEGLATQWRQADGTMIDLRVFGDELSASTETPGGYTVIYDPARQSYFYAKPAKGDVPLEPSNIQAHHAPPETLEKHLRQPAKVAAAIRTESIRWQAPDRAGKWRDRVRAANARRNAAGHRSRSNIQAPDFASGSKVGLVILVQFPDDPATAAVDPVNFPASVSKYVRLCNEVGYQEDGNAGSIRDYFFDQSNGALTFTQSVTQVVTLPHPRAYYNYSDYPVNKYLPKSGSAGRKMVSDAVAILKSTGFDFSGLTTNAWGQVLSTSIVFAGPSSGLWSYGLWPHSSSVTEIDVGPCKIYGYQCANVENKAPVIGTMCHELGHLLLDYPDLYDTNASDGDSEGVGEHCLMGSGNHLDGGKSPAPINLYLKEISGWADITDLSPTETLDTTLPSTGNRGYRIRKSGSSAEYFLLENRGPGDRWSRACRDLGVAIWHVDESVIEGNNEQHMTAAQHYQISLEQADGKFHLEKNANRGDYADLFDSQRASFNPSTVPNSNWWDGSPSGVSIWVTSPALASINVRFGATLPLETLRLSASSRTATPLGGEFTFNISSSTSWSWSCDADWLVSAEASNQSGNQTFGYKISENLTDSDRTATIILTTGQLIQHHTITQPHAVTVPPNSTTPASFDYRNEEDYFRLVLPNPGIVTIETTGGMDTSGRLMDADGKYIIENYDSGKGYNMRIRRTMVAGTYYLRIHEQSDAVGDYLLVIEVEPLALQVSEAIKAVPAQGGRFRINISSNSTWTWKGETNWLTSNESQSQSLNREFSYRVLRNTSKRPRSATLRFICGGRVVTHVIRQAAAEHERRVMRREYSIGIVENHVRHSRDTAARSRETPYQFLVQEAGDRFLAIRIPASARTRADKPVIEVSPNLVDWFSGSDHTTVMSNEPSFYQVRDNTPVRPGTKRYIRIRPIL